MGNASLFPNDVTKTAYIINLLQGAARKWIRSIVQKAITTGKDPFKDLTELFDAIRRHFGDPDSKTTADRAIRKLR